jgi:metal-sulfur cluster biosynthetic enzyme
MTVLQQEVMSLLHGIVDPCSVATNVPLSIVEMGMVEKVEIASGKVVIAFRVTSPFCHALPYFEMEVERVLGGVRGIEAVKCIFDHGANWQPDDMTEAARQKLADRREFVRSHKMKESRFGSEDDC